MTDDHQLDFTVTPYYDEGSSPAPIRSPFGWHYLPAATWLVSAIVAVAAGFLEVYRLHYEDTSADQVTIPNVSLGYDGWGRHHFTSSDSNFSQDLISGSRWGTLFTICAGLILLAAIWSVLPRWQFRLIGPADLALAGTVGLAGSVTALVLSFGPERHQLAITSEALTSFHWGWCWQVEAVAAVLGLVGWVVHRWQHAHSEPIQADPVPERTASFTSWAGPLPDDSMDEDEDEVTYPQTGNWLDGATDRPHIPRDPGPSPW